MKKHKLKINEITTRKYLAHEAPVCILDEVQKYVDYDYCLVHLLEESEEYRNYFYNRSHDFVILDNSIFELGEAFEAGKYRHYVEELEPSIYIMPDVLGNKEATVDNAAAWRDKNIKVDAMAVVQGQSMDELVDCYIKFNALKIKAIAIGFNHEFFIADSCSRDWDQANGRIRFIKYLKEKNIWNPNCYHHLLGCTLPFELSHGIYQDINSIDTSSPVLHGLLNVEYDELSLQQKRKIKVNELMYSTVYPEQLKIIVDNIKKFRYIVK